MTINIEYETDQELGIDYAALHPRLRTRFLKWRNAPMTDRSILS